MRKIKFIGGARLGGVNYTWPLVILTTTESELILKTIFQNKYIFPKEDIHDIKSMTWLPILAEGIKISHKVSSYPEFITFWYWKPYQFLKSLKSLGFKL
ncbi:hypothetical protein P700755_000321 [Psychroflexus torquis ATCC 700755]|uniref:Uncharacterized protein n=1 Tax=Psychroflexus torquis (strain ATCC 700755 / CIP 106069 / ACAM 623) TaxID=313595 RepID=K4IAA4_PSYTT|nr:hypothetical protein [Psychroflexus torquis]AFU67359.1 hypothetical protein P700755_000321 [Psychroflexus torquis ATCC 700755]